MGDSLFATTGANARGGGAKPVKTSTDNTFPRDAREFTEIVTSTVAKFRMDRNQALWGGGRRGGGGGWVCKGKRKSLASQWVRRDRLMSRGKKLPRDNFCLSLVSQLPSHAGLIVKEDKKPSLVGERQFGRHFMRQFGRGYSPFANSYLPITFFIQN